MATAPTRPTQGHHSSVLGGTENYPRRKGLEEGGHLGSWASGFLYCSCNFSVGFPGGSAVKNPPANAGDAGLIPGSERSLEEEMATHSSILAWEIPWTEEPGRPQSMGLQSQT